MLIAKFALIYILISLGIIYLSRYLGYFDKPNKRGIHKIPIINTGFNTILLETGVDGQILLEVMDGGIVVQLIIIILLNLRILE